MSAPQRYGFGRAMLLGYGALAVMMLSIGAWAVTAELAGAVIASGVIKAEGDRKSVQHPVGGVIEAVLVTEGQAVDAGEILLRLDGQDLLSEQAILDGQFIEIMARKARLAAERDGAESVAFDPDLLRTAEASSEVRSILDGEQRLFEARRTTRRNESAKLAERRQQVLAEIEGTQSQLRALEEQRDLAASERDDQEKLLSRGLTQKTRVLALRREVSRLGGQIGELRARLARLRGQVAEMEIEELRIAAAAREAAMADLRDLEYNQASLRERRAALAERIDALDLRAPVSGFVHDLRANAKGQVLRPADTVMFLIPGGDDIVIEARVNAMDVDQVFAGQEAVIVFPSLNQRTTPEFRGRVARVSADAFTDEATGQAFYELELDISDSAAELADGAILIPGMPVEAFVMTSQRTPMNYLLKPFTDYFNKALRES